MVKKILIQKDAYFDSVVLMLTSKSVKEIQGVEDAVVAMGTKVNLALLEGTGFTSAETGNATPNDLIIAVEGLSDKVVDSAIAAARSMLKQRRSTSEGEDEYHPVSLDTARAMVPDANLVIISVPGRYASREAKRALDKGLHVMLFSDNVPLEEEIDLKRKAVEAGLLMMGPDCGTAIINGKPLCFANGVRQGTIGIVSASGTGLQEVSCRIDDLGGGISQAIGTGGRDLHRAVGGLTTLMGLKALGRDPRTEVVVAISKPPDRDVADKVLAATSNLGKPAVIHFIGEKPGTKTGKIRFAGNLEETAGMAVALSRGETYRSRTYSMADKTIRDIIRMETRGISKGQKYLRGLFTGGTLAYEAMACFSSRGTDIHANIQTDPARILKDPGMSRGHTIVDLGDDFFTSGRPHPMIDPSIREERIQRESDDPEVALLLLDFVMGNGAHQDPCGALRDSLVLAKQKAKERGGYLPIIASLTGTRADAQNLDSQRDMLTSIGCVVMPSNYQAARLALEIIAKASS